MKYCRILLPLIACAVALFLSGCVTQLDANVSPGTKIGDLKKFYVVRLPQDQRGIERLIADRLNIMGKQATSGEKSAIPADVDAIVTYQDKWMWDMTMYMLQLDVQVRQPKTEMAIASGHTMRTSLARKNPTEMIQIVLTEIFKKS